MKNLVKLLSNVTKDTITPANISLYEVLFREIANADRLSSKEEELIVNFFTVIGYQKTMRWFVFIVDLAREDNCILEVFARLCINDAKLKKYLYRLLKINESTTAEKMDNDTYAFLQSIPE